MATSFRIKPYAHPRLKFVVRSKISGKWERKFFRTKAEAQTFVQQKEIELLNQGKEGVTFPSWLRVMAQRENDRLHPFGKTLTDAVEFYLPHLQSMAKSCTFQALTDELIAHKEQDGASFRYLADLRSRLGQFAASQGGKLVAAITDREVDEWLRGLSNGAGIPLAPTTRNNFRRVLKVAFNFALGRGYCVSNPATKSAKAKEVKTAARILTLQQASDLLTHADAEILPGVALGLFSGIRPESEGFQRLDWSHIDFEDKTINVEPDKTKADSSARYVDMSDNLVAWLLPHRKLKGFVFPVVKRYYALLGAARAKAKIRDWPHDALRHSFGSIHYGTHRNAAHTMAQMGHTNPQIFFKHYRKPIKKTVADKYWLIVPSAGEAKIVSFAAA